jgi:hypothetical protein
MKDIIIGFQIININRFIYIIIKKIYIDVF